MKSKLPNNIPSGIEPVDKLTGGLESNQLYLVHGEASGKSLFGIKFLIEGLKRGENGALVIRYSPEDAVRRFARLGYDCLEDVYSGRLVILEYSNDIIQQIARLRELTPVLRELEWLLGETRAERLVFDPVTNLVVGEEGNLEPRVREFASWATSFGATVLLVANAENEEVIEEFKPLVQESFRFEVRGEGEHATQFLAFEKSSSVPDQAVEVDPARGVFLLDRQQAAEHIFSKFHVQQPPTAEPEPVNIEAKEIEDIKEIEGMMEEPRADLLADEGPAIPLVLEPVEATAERASSIKAENLFEAEILNTDEMRQGHEQDVSQPSPPEDNYPAAHIDTQPLSAEKANGIFTAYKQARNERPAGPPPPESQTVVPAQKLFSDLLDELSDEPSLLELDVFDEGFPPAPEAIGANREPASLSSGAQQQSILQSETQPAAFINREGLIAEDGSMTDRDIDALVTSRAVEILLRPPQTPGEPPSAISLPEMPPPPPRAAAQVDQEATGAAQPKDFSVLVIDDDISSCEAVRQTLGEYTVEVVHDGVSGLARLISLKPDLIILDVDLPIIDGFKVLAHIRTSLNMPVIIVSGSHMRASDRMLAAELGADYYLTKPFSVKELRQKARQLIARYRGIASWIITAPQVSEPRAEVERRGDRQSRNATARDAAANHYAAPVEESLCYKDFVAQVEKSVKAGIDNGTSFSIVGCRLPDMTANGGQVAVRLYELVRSLVRETDLVSTDPRNDLVILLADADSAGARAFINRMREQILKEMNQEPTVWLRSFPDLEESDDSATPGSNAGNVASPGRRASDRTDQEGNDPQSRASDVSLTVRSASIQ